MQLVRRRERRPVEPLRAGQIEIGFVDRRHFDARRKSLEDLIDFARVFDIAIAVALYKYRLGAEAVGSAERHRGMHAKLPRGIRRGGDDATLVRPPTHDHGLAFERRIEQFFHGDEEGVHVEVKVEPAHGFLATATRGIPARSALVSTCLHVFSMAQIRSEALHPISMIRNPPGRSKRHASGMRRR